MEQVPDSKKMETLNSAFGAASTRWWNEHNQNIHNWTDCQKFLRLRFTDQFQEVRSRFNGQTSPQLHLELRLLDGRMVIRRIFIVGQIVRSSFA